MRLEAQKYLFDVREALNLVAEYCADETYQRYAVSSMLRAAVERQFITAGEALAQMARIDPAAFERIPDARQLVSFRNLLVHGYQTIDDFVVWEVVTSDLGNLRSVVEEMLEEGETP